VDKEVDGHFWYTKRQVDSFGGHRGRWPGVVDEEAGGLLGGP